ncbi:3-deoxy-manno-octulosonate cytidylyltransferase [Olivibacter sp. SDN3]|uniref:3-deoxy-manno-octulosonate cytidylyltransferase n=1 Tax=Olivibacter sp. SDN3 TaxID=2764720 RepID=UPI0016519EC6|nr:3-deoxy-manno-octulosonate cytidylyltransferase [Olivibacter sp. SDN3]QNL48682.1 3-deoxy-manno-octulosonate cytidylyltransferase [Olivibacter sp. SDN3]
MNIIGIIPARYASTRFPGKPLVAIHGKSMIQRVYEQAAKAPSLQQVVVATDDDRIAHHVDGFGGKVIMTAPTHQSGTDRCAEVIAIENTYDIAINIQGDEPYIDPAQIELLASCFENSETQIATLVKKINTYHELFNTNTPKVLLNNMQEAIYFSRTALPFQRDIAPENWLEHYVYYKHIGIYGYRCEVLTALTNLPISALEKAEALEQLRWLENGYRIKTAETSLETLAIDEPDDLNKLK